MAERVSTSMFKKYCRTLKHMGGPLEAVNFVINEYVATTNLYDGRTDGFEFTLVKYHHVLIISY